MDRDTFFSLPPTIAVRILFDALDEDAARYVAEMDAPKAPLPPKFDLAIFRAEGIQWASEMDLDSLRFWHKKATENSNPQYAEQNRKRAANLERWIAWREWYPDTTWSGERDSKQGVARPPTRKPKTYPRPNGDGQRRQAPAHHDDIDPNADIPY